MITGSAVFYLLLLAALILTGVYFLTMGKRRRPRIHADLQNWTTEHKKPRRELSHTVFMIGDAGAPLLAHPDPVLEMLRRKLSEKKNKGSVVFLGDNIYPLGLPAESEPAYDLAKKRIDKLLDSVKDHPGGIYFISGNHDWKRGRKGGMKAVIRQERYVNSVLGRKDAFLPAGAKPGPVEIAVSTNVSVVFINTVWWLYRTWRERKSKSSRETDAEFFRKLRQILDQNLHKHVIIAAHHPMYSMSFHGGKFSLKQHLFPLTELGKKWYVPIPGAGSLYPLYRKYIGSVEDMAHPRYRQLKSELLSVLSDYKNVTFCAGHDHNLQYLEVDNHHHLVSGSGSKVTHVRGSESAMFTHAHKGFFEISCYRDGSMWIGAWEPGAEEDVLAFSRFLKPEQAMLTPVQLNVNRESA